MKDTKRIWLWLILVEDLLQQAYQATIQRVEIFVYVEIKVQREQGQWLNLNEDPQRRLTKLQYKGQKYLFIDKGTKRTGAVANPS